MSIFARIVKAIARAGGWHGATGPFPPASPRDAATPAGTSHSPPAATGSHDGRR